MNLDLRFYWKIFLRRFPVMAILFTLCTGLGVVSALRMPESFATSARLLVEEPQIPENMVSSTVRTDAVEQLDIIQQRLLTRANLIDIANRFDVYEDLREVEPDIVVRRMNQDTTIRRSAGRNQATLMTISFRGRSGQVVANVVNEYVTLVLEENASFRIGRAENTLDFFEQEVNRLGEELDAQSVRIATFKSENAAALPEDQSYRLGRQTLLQERLSLLERDLRSSQSQRADLERIFQTTGRVGRENGQALQSPEERQLIAARAELDLLLDTYSTQNPRVTRQQSTVDRLEAIVAAQSAAILETTEASASNVSPAEAMFQANLIEMDNRIDTLSSDVARTQEELSELQGAISASSVNGIQLNALERDYEIIQTRYNAAVANLNQARMSERIETTAQGQRITVVENANVPRLPSGPSQLRVVAMASGMGMALALGFFVLLELLNRTVRRPAELEGRFNVTPIASIPYLESRTRRMVRRMSLVVGSLVALIGVPAALWYIDATYLPLDLLVQNVLQRVGVL